jgi:hypothetical protein
MKNFKKFAVALVAVVLVIFIGVTFKAYWMALVANAVIWICNMFGVGTPSWVKSFANAGGVTAEDTASDEDYVGYGDNTND